MDLLNALLHALSISFAMTWEILWALILGFVLSAAVEAVVSKEQISRLLPDDSPRTLGLAALLGAASSSCSYAAVALARSLFQKSANFTAAMAFEIASTNLVIELGIILVILMGSPCSFEPSSRRPASQMLGRKQRRASAARWRVTRRWTCRCARALSRTRSSPARASRPSATCSS